MNVCTEQERLRAEVHAVLAQIDRTNREQMEALSTGDDDRLMKLDKVLEALIGNKERVYGALFQHRNEHGCQFNGSTPHPKDYLEMIQPSTSPNNGNEQIRQTLATGGLMPNDVNGSGLK